MFLFMFSSRQKEFKQHNFQGGKFLFGYQQRTNRITSYLRERNDYRQKMNDCFFFQIATMTTTTVMFLLIAITTSTVAAFGPVAHTATSSTTSARIFSSSLLKPSQQLHRLHHQREVCSSRRSMSLGGEEEEAVATIPDDEAKYYQPLSEDEIRTMLDAIPVYAVTDSNKDNGIVLLKESDNENEIANFFFSPDMANSVYAPLKSKRKGDGVIWDVTRFSLGLIWYDLLKNPASSNGGSGSSSSSSSMAVDGIEYRLVPNSQDLAEARNMLEQSIQQSQGENAKIPNDFQAPYNEIPVFIDQFLRVVQNDEERVPMYFGMQELIATCQQAIDATSGEYQASINIASLHSLVQQMQSKSTVDFRQAIMIPPTTPPVATTQATAEAKDEESKIDKILNKKPAGQQPPKAELELPMATDDLWSD